MLSVVIPTYNRCQTLAKAISSYFAQTARKQISEIIVVDDGSTDTTRSVVKELASQSAFPIRYFRQKNKGPAAARNVGIREAQSPLILFTDDDILPGRELVAEHLKSHANYPADSAAVLGFVTWARDVHPTPFMEWYGSEVLFSFNQLFGPAEIEGKFFYTCNISLKTDFLRTKGTFDEEFPIAAYEDIELGLRLSASGMRLFYNPQAIAYHDQFISFADACKKHQKSVFAADIFSNKEVARPFRDSLQGTPPGNQRLKKWLAPLFSPVKAVLDWRIPLPWRIYRTMFRIYR
jgi:glycosyltransferase involved in cell wall biosynthesis